MIHRAYQLSSTPTAFSAECNKLRSTFLNLDYPINLINSAINKFLRNIDNIDAAKNTRDDSSTIIVPLPFKDQPSANSVKKQMQVLSANIGVQFKPVFQTKKIGQVLAPKEKKPPIVSNQCVTISAGFTVAMIIDHFLPEEEKDVIDLKDVIASKDDIQEDSDMDRVVIDADDKEVILSIHAERRLLKLLNEREKRSSLYI